RERVRELEITLLSVDAVAGVADGFTSHALQRVPLKSLLGPVSLGSVLGALGLKLAVVEDPERLAKSRRHPAWQTARIAYVRRSHKTMTAMFLEREAERLLAARAAETAALGYVERPDDARTLAA